jgi:hypothetical protein
VDVLVGTGAFVRCSYVAILTVAGANFPAWMLCVILGAIGAAVVRLPLTAIGIEPHLGPRTIIYPSLAFLIGCAFYLIFFNRI